MQEKSLVHKMKFSSLFNMFSLDNASSVNIIAGPCSVESVEQMNTIAQKLKQNDVHFIRGGAYKPRTSPYAFQGLGIEGLKIMKQICDTYSLISVSEIMDPRDVAKALEYIDIIQIGARNMYNVPLLKEIGKTSHPVILKRGLMSTLKEFLLAAEYIISEGNQNLILCERGIRTFEDSTRNTLDISSIAIIMNETSLPVIVDLSHSLGWKDIIIQIAKSVMALGVDGIMIEVHNKPHAALSDENQQLSLDEFQSLFDHIKTFKTSCSDFTITL